MTKTGSLLVISVIRKYDKALSKVRLCRNSFTKLKGLLKYLSHDRLSSGADK